MDDQGGPGSVEIHLTEAEAEALQRLEGLGSFLLYFLCDLLPIDHLYCSKIKCIQGFQEILLWKRTSLATKMKKWQRITSSRMVRT